MHPLALLVALKTYAQGHGDKGKLTWKPRQKIVDALDDAFYLSFETLAPTGARTLLALDVSGSMTGPNDRGHAGHLAARGQRGDGAGHGGSRAEPRDRRVHERQRTGRVLRVTAAGITPVAISPRMRLDDVDQGDVSDLPFGGTDCALPMLWAADNKVPVDVFCVYTDSETWAGDIHPVQALRAYRQKMGIGARLVVIGMVSNGFTHR